MSDVVALKFLPPSDTIKYLNRDLNLSPDVIARLEGTNVDGNFLRELYSKGIFKETLNSPPFSIPYGPVSHIYYWVLESIREAKTYQITPTTYLDIISRDYVYASIAQRLEEIQLELDYILRKLNGTNTQSWFYNVKSHMKFGPKVATRMLFTEAIEQNCYTELVCAIAKVLPQTGEKLLSVKKLDPTKVETEGLIQKNMNSNRNPFVESMEMQSQTKSMLASTLLSQTKDVVLKKHVTRCMLALGENDAWLKFAKVKGATSGSEAEKRISEAQATGEPESIVIPAIARAPNYLATTFLSDLKGINMKHVTENVEKIEEHLACVESAVQDRGNKVAQVNSSIRQWIIQNNLCDTSSQTEIQARVDSLKDFEVTSLEDLKILDKEDFEKCGFRGVNAKKAFLAVSSLK